jgi:hypothetical protein
LDNSTKSEKKYYFDTDINVVTKTYISDIQDVCLTKKNAADIPLWGTLAADDERAILRLNQTNLTAKWSQ